MNLIVRALRTYRREGMTEVVRLGRKYILNRVSPELWPTIHYNRYIYQKLKYRNPTHPTDLLYIQPSAIDKYTHKVSKYRGLGQIKGGTWDTDWKKLSENWKYAGLIERFEEGKKWEDTQYVRIPNQKFFTEGKIKDGYDNAEDFIEYRCSYVDSLYESMKREGYKPNTDNVHSDFPSQDQRSESRMQSLEPLVCIDRKGKIILRDGFHRITIAQIIGIDKIPVHVLCRHKLWQIKKDKFLAGGLDSNSAEHDQVENHPDL